MTTAFPTPIDVTVTSLGGLGDGISTHNGKPLFISKSCIGDRLSVRIIHQNHDGYQGTIESILSPGPNRIAPPCPYYADCGGCSLQHLTPDAYRDFKTHMLHTALRSGGFSSEHADMVFLPAGLRRRVEFSLAHDHGRVSMAFNKQRTNQRVPVDNCLVLHQRLQALMQPLAEALSALKAVEIIESVGLTLADSGIDLVLECGHAPGADDFDALKTLAGIDRIFWKDMVGKLQLVVQRQPVTMQLGAYDIDLPPDAFLQATKAGQQALTEFALDATKHAASVIDLFCGIGSYAFALAAHARVHAVEGDARMTAAVQRGIKKHAVKGMTAEERDLFKHPLTAGELSRFDAAVINPPRIGAKAQTQAVADSNIATVAMISCNPATFARDAKILKNAGFTLTRATGVDQFVYSPFLEIAALFER